MYIDSKRRYLLRLMGAGMIVSLVGACTGNKESGPVPGNRFPVFTLPDLDGRQVSLTSFSGSLLVLNFWASWCEPCRQEMASLQQLSELYRSSGDVQVVGISVDRDVNLAREFVLNNGITFPMLSDADMTFSTEVLRIQGFPTTYLLAADRTVVQIVTGGLDWTGRKQIDLIERVLNANRKL